MEFLLYAIIKKNITPAALHSRASNPPAHSAEEPLLHLTNSYEEIAVWA